MARRRDGRPRDGCWKGEETRPLPPLRGHVPDRPGPAWAPPTGRWGSTRSVSPADGLADLAPGVSWGERYPDSSVPPGQCAPPVGGPPPWAGTASAERDIEDDNEDDIEDDVVDGVEYGVEHWPVGPGDADDVPAAGADSRAGWAR